VLYKMNLIIFQGNLGLQIHVTFSSIQVMNNHGRGIDMLLPKGYPPFTLHDILTNFLGLEKKVRRRVLRIFSAAAIV